MMSAATTVRSVDRLFEPIALRNISLRNRIIRSATYEGYGDRDGNPNTDLADLYIALAKGNVGAIITGFTFVSQAGRAMQPGQCGIDTDERIQPWQDVVVRVRRQSKDVPLFMQIAHTGRQTMRKATGLPVVGVSPRKCSYFRQAVRVLDDSEIEQIIGQFAEAARRAREAGFDGVQLHAAHGYLIHQFLSPWTNTRRDTWADGPLFLERVIRAIREKNGDDFPILVKLSWADDNTPGIDLAGTIRTVKRLEELAVDAVEISYGSMEFALNIIRGACPANTILKINPLFSHIPPFAKAIWKRVLLPRYTRRFIPFSHDYNVDAALTVKAQTQLPIIPVGGIRAADSMLECLKKGLPAVSLCRPLICEPDLPRKLQTGEATLSRCTNCNLCTAYCDSARRLKCYQNGKDTQHENA